VGYVEQTGIEEGAVPVRRVANSHVLAGISIDDDTEMLLAVAFHLNVTAALVSPRESASRRYLEDEGNGRSFG